MCEHQAGRGHPERPERLASLQRLVERLAGDGLVERVDVEPAERESIERVHARGHVDYILGKRGQSVRIDVDTAMCPESADAALLAAGASIGAVDALLDGRAAATIALVRPPGHHAETDRAMGFCLFNNIAIAAAHAVASHGLRRVLIVDWDVHHGNGTQHQFEDRADVLYFSIHQHPNYPGTGALHETGRGGGEGFTVNVPLPPGFGDGAYLLAMRDILAPIADAYRPEIVLVSAGFDAHRNDPLAHMNVTEAGFAAMMRAVLDVADAHAEGRLALFLEGGYHLEALTSSVEACFDILGGKEPPAIDDADPEEVDRVRSIRARHAREWPALQGGDEQSS